ncbi:hypothetical protein [Pusillimonas sp. NJUB218]|uniref:hypothetical protein n=1 Tax=Pusillimonas sp. NJUB218 TaxID=2023230 RepID=UPI000F4B8164|nr:hypothetical protein [Pusillimonas sp. NJUB218]ROT45045.1 hypothetical protein CHR62_09345 [Pusillimonas sp. NJUB218]
MITEDQFLKEVDQHVMEVIRGDGLYRHVRFRRPDTMCMHFDLITWPGYLCYCGDMGTYVFCRLEDMFEFFRTDRDYAHRRGRKLFINPGYWSEKLQAVDGNRNSASAKEFSAEKFEQTVKDWLAGWMRHRGLDKEGRRELRQLVEDSVLACAYDGDVRAFDAAMNFSKEVGGQRFEFTDFWEVDCTEYTHRFMWCCYALAWGIQQYDESKTLQEAA